MGSDNTNPQKPSAPMADDQTNQMIANMQRMQQSGAFDTPYQKAMKNHPVRMGLSNAMMAFGQGITKQPYYTGTQESQAQLQNTQQQGINSISTLPAQLRMMMAMQQMGPGQGQVPGAPTAMPTTTNPMAAQMAAAKAAGYSEAEVKQYLSGRK